MSQEDLLVMATEAFITPEILRWARERDQLSAERAAEWANVNPDRLKAWESGSSRPTFRQAQLLAQRLHIPFGYLFLSAPPEEEVRLPDLRTIADRPASQPSPELRDVLDDALAKQSWYRDYQESERATPLGFVGRYSLESAPEEVATAIRYTLDIGPTLRERAANWEAFLRALITRAERAGVLVLRSGIVAGNTHRPLNVEEFRGFAIADEVAPLIFINSRDAKGAQIFTLAHELAHIWVGASGISNPDYRAPASQQASAVERLSNRTAAEVLLPREEFVAAWLDSRSARENVRAISAQYKVSNMVALRQALDLGLLARPKYSELYSELVSRDREKPREDDGGNFYNSFYARNSRAFATAVIDALGTERVSYLDAARLLNVRVATLDRVKENLVETGGAVG